MKKLLFFIIVIIFQFTANAQKANIVIEYDYHINILNYKSFLISNERESFYFFTENRNLKYTDLEEENSKAINKYFIFNYNFSTDHILQTLPPIGNNSIEAALAKDKVEDIIWEIGEEKKQILKFNCALATAIFRGSKYKVWFTTDITMNAFPWKLKGLPGVILAYEDEGGLIKAEATSVSLNSGDYFPIKIANFFNEKKNASIPYKDFIVLQNKHLKDAMHEQIAQLPKGSKYVVPEVRQMQLEKTFEWETRPTKP